MVRASTVDVVCACIILRCSGIVYIKYVVLISVSLANAKEIFRCHARFLGCWPDQRAAHACKTAHDGLPSPAGGDPVQHVEQLKLRCVRVLGRV